VLSRNSSGSQDARAASLVIFQALADTPIAGGYRVRMSGARRTVPGGCWASEGWIISANSWTTSPSTTITGAGTRPSVAPCRQRFTAGIGGSGLTAPRKPFPGTVTGGSSQTRGLPPSDWQRDVRSASRAVSKDTGTHERKNSTDSAGKEPAQECRTVLLGEDISLGILRAVSVPRWLPD